MNPDTHTAPNLYTYTKNNPILYKDNDGTEEIVAIPLFQMGAETITAYASTGFLSSLSMVAPVFAFVIGIFVPSSTASDDGWGTIENYIYGTVGIDGLIAVLNEAKRKGDADTKDIKVPTNQHHIVAKISPYAEEARNILLANNICPFTDQDNIVTVSTKMHQYMHKKYIFMRLT